MNTLTNIQKQDKLGVKLQPNFWAVVPCAGTGLRTGIDLPKQYALLNGKPVVAYTLDALQSVAALAGVTVVVAPTDTLFKHHCPDFKGVVALVGGATRAQSVRAGLKALYAQGAQGTDWVLVHDAARCLVKPEWIEMLIKACAHDEVGGLLAQPVPDTLKQAQNGRSVATVNRHDKWLAQTPQMFRLGVLEQALDEAEQKGLEVTDEASSIEAMGLQPKLVACSAENFKLTYREDFERAQAILKNDVRRRQK